MTLPYERTNAVKNTRQFLVDLLNPQKTPRVPSHYRQMAAGLLKHFPSDMDMDIISDKEDGSNFMNYQVFSKKYTKW